MIILSSQRANWPARMYTSRKMCKYGGLNALVPAAIYARKEVGGGGWVGWGFVWVGVVWVWRTMHAFPKQILYTQRKHLVSTHT